ncbi:MAG: hypothetical protein KDA57_21100 [Planctomycetales bacterium]|nr:hypothetical protein [Planctomycetales bacterium]
MEQASRKKAFWCVAAIVGVAAGWFAWRADSQPVLANQFSATASVPGGLITHVVGVEGRLTRVVVVDPQARVMGVYDIGQEKGEIQLKSVRRIAADLQLLEFNTGDPLPTEIQNRLDQQ